MTGGIKLNRVIEVMPPDYGLFKYDAGGITFHVGAALFAAHFDSSRQDSFCSVSAKGATFSGHASSMVAVIWRPRV